MIRLSLCENCNNWTTCEKKESLPDSCDDFKHALCSVCKKPTDMLAFGRRYLCYEHYCDLFKNIRLSLCENCDYNAFGLPSIPLKGSTICIYCKKEISVGDYYLTSPEYPDPKCMCSDCYKGRTIFPIAIICHIEKS